MRSKSSQHLNQRLVSLVTLLLVIVCFTRLSVAQDAVENKLSPEFNGPPGKAYAHKKASLRPRTPPITFTSAIELPAPRSISRSPVLPMTSGTASAFVTQMPTPVETQMPSPTQGTTTPIFTGNGATSFMPTATAPANNPRIQPNSSSSKSTRACVTRTTGERLFASGAWIGLVLIGQWAINAH